MTAGSLIAVAAMLGVIIGPLLLSAAGWLRTRGKSAPAAPPRPWRITLDSTLAFALAFNLTFFIQELFLVLPKALTPGLRPTLFHNNHTWSGSHPLEDLFQGTGALATSIASAVCWALLARGRDRSATSRLLLLWMTYAGLFMALPQVVVGAVSNASDLGRAMNYFALGSGARSALALVALLAMPWLALRLSRHFLALSPDVPPSPRGRSRFMFHVATLPALLGIALIVPFRVPREWIEVVIVPVAVVLAGVPWMQAGAWRAAPAGVPTRASASPFVLLIALAVLLAIFQLVLRRGIPFY
jgi:hypothetical protein